MNLKQMDIEYILLYIRLVKIIHLINKIREHALNLSTRKIRLLSKQYLRIMINCKAKKQKLILVFGYLNYWILYIEVRRVLSGTNNTVSLKNKFFDLQMFYVRWML